MKRIKRQSPNALLCCVISFEPQGYGWTAGIETWLCKPVIVSLYPTYMAASLGTSGYLQGHCDRDEANVHRSSSSGCESASPEQRGLHSRPGKGELRKNRPKVGNRREMWLSKFRTKLEDERHLTPWSDSRTSPWRALTTALQESSFLWIRTRTPVWTPVTIVKWLGGEDEKDCEDKLIFESRISRIWVYLRFPGRLFKLLIPKLYCQKFWLNRSGAEPKSLHFYQSPPPSKDFQDNWAQI